jgi:hypothetical protein
MDGTQQLPNEEQQKRINLPELINQQMAAQQAAGAATPETGETVGDSTNTAPAIPPQETATAAPAGSMPRQQPQVEPGQQPPELIGLLAQLVNENQQLKAAMGQAQQMAGQQNQLNEEAIQKVLTTPIPPDPNWAITATENEVLAANEKYAQEMQEFTRQSIMQELDPFIQRAKQEETNAKRITAAQQLKSHPQHGGKFKDIDAYMPKLQGMINGDVFSKPLEEDAKLMMSYALAKLLDQQEAQPDTAEAIFQKASKNPEVMKMLKLQELQAAQQNGAIPAQSASANLQNIAVGIPEKAPQNWNEARANAAKRAIV